jgi:hypothetical protein
VSRRNRKDIPVRTYNGSNFFRVSRDEADGMLARRQAFVLAEWPRELQLLQGPPGPPQPLAPDLSLLMSPCVIRSAAQRQAGYVAKATVEGWGGRREDFEWATIGEEGSEVQVRIPSFEPRKGKRKGRPESFGILKPKGETMTHVKEQDCDGASPLKPLQSPYWKVVSADELEKELVEIAARDLLKRRTRVKRPNV